MKQAMLKMVIVRMRKLNDIPPSLAFIPINDIALIEEHESFTSVLTTSCSRRDAFYAVSCCGIWTNFDCRGSYKLSFL